MKPRKVKEDDAPRTIACPHKVSVLCCPSLFVADTAGFLVGVILKLHFSLPLRDAPRCSGTTLRWGNTCIPTGLACTSAQSAAKRSSRVQSWRGISSYTRERSLSRWAPTFSYTSGFSFNLSVRTGKYLLWLLSRTWKFILRCLLCSADFVCQKWLYANLAISSAVATLERDITLFVSQNETRSCINPSPSFIPSAHSRAAASGSPWTLTCAHTCVFTLETVRTFAPSTAATKSLPSQPTWSLTSSHTPKPKTTSEWATLRANDNAKQTLEDLTCVGAPRQPNVPWPALLWDMKSLCVASR